MEEVALNRTLERNCLHGPKDKEQNQKTMGYLVEELWSTFDLLKLFLTRHSPILVLMEDFKCPLVLEHSHLDYLLPLLILGILS